MKTLEANWKQSLESLRGKGMMVVVGVRGWAGCKVQRKEEAEKGGPLVGSVVTNSGS